MIVVLQPCEIQGFSAAMREKEKWEYNRHHPERESGKIVIVKMGERSEELGMGPQEGKS